MGIMYQGRTHMLDSGLGGWMVLGIMGFAAVVISFFFKERDQERQQRRRRKLLFPALGHNLLLPTAHPIPSVADELRAASDEQQAAAMSRREALQINAALVGSGLLTLMPREASADGQSMATSLVGGAGNMAGKTRPETGIILKDGVPVERSKDDGRVTAAVLVGGGPDALYVTFTSPFPLAKGMAYDLECRSKDSTVAVFGQVERVGKPADVTPAWVGAQVLSKDGRFGAFGPATDIRCRELPPVSKSPPAPRLFDVTFNALTPGGLEAPRRCVVAVQQSDSSAFLLVGGTAAGKWEANADAIINCVASLQTTSKATPEWKKGRSALLDNTVQRPRYYENLSEADIRQASIMGG